MKYLSILFLLFFLVAACNSRNTAPEEKQEDLQIQAVEGSYGELVSESNAVPVTQLKDMLREKDSLQMKLTGEIAACCQSSGCWMDLNISEDEKLKVTFTDYDLVIPKDSKGKTTYIEGVARKELIPVETLRNRAAEEGKSKEEIAAIHEPEWSYSFEAKGVLIKENDE